MGQIRDPGAQILITNYYSGTDAGPRILITNNDDSGTDTGLLITNDDSGTDMGPWVLITNDDSGTNTGLWTKGHPYYPHVLRLFI